MIEMGDLILIEFTEDTNGAAAVYIFVEEYLDDRFLTFDNPKCFHIAYPWFGRYPRMYSCIPLMTVKSITKLTLKEVYEMITSDKILHASARDWFLDLKTGKTPLESLLTDENPAIREFARKVLI